MILRIIMVGFFLGIGIYLGLLFISRIIKGLKNNPGNRPPENR